MPLLQVKRHEELTCHQAFLLRGRAT